MSRVRVCFMGTPQFACVALKGLLEDEHYEVVGVVTQPNRRSGRKMQLQPSPVRKLAESVGLPVLTPERINKDEAAIQTLEEWRCDIGVVVAFGQILSNRILNMPTHGSVNLHASLLPRWRGAAPIQRAIQAGDEKAGVALQKMVAKLDAGDVLGSREFVVDDDMDAMDVHDRLAELGVELLHVEMMDYVRGNLIPQAQDESQVTYAEKIEKAEGEIDWSAENRVIFNKIRAFQMGPGCFTHVGSDRLKIHASRPASLTGAAGEVLDAARFIVGTGKGSLELTSVQPASKPRMSGADYCSGYGIEKGDILGA